MDGKSKVKYTTIINKYPSFRDEKIKACWRWLEGRQEDDNAEGYWRVHDKLYNLNDFKERHPGGKEWIAWTKGTDITEAFESYHVLPKASQLLSKFYVKEADQPRNYKLTFDDDGFYRTLKRRVAAKLPELDKSDMWKSKFYLDLIVCGFFISSVMTIRAESMVLKVLFYFLASLCVTWINAAAHNFIHQRNNFRMYAANLVMIGWRDWRVFHGMSHHLYPNSYADLEVSAYEPYHNWLPVKERSPALILLTYILTPAVYALIFHSNFIYHYFGIIYSKYQKYGWDELLIFSPPVVMFVFGNPTFTFNNIYAIALVWTAIILFGGALYSLMAINIGHHGPSFVHEGDEFKSLDFGIYQMGTTVDRIEANSNLAIGLTHFGDHTLHHLFPSLDQSLLPQLRGILHETCEEFDVKYRKWNSLDAVFEQFRQLSRTNVTTLDESNNNNNNNDEVKKIDKNISSFIK